MPASADERRTSVHRYSSVCISLVAVARPTPTLHVPLRGSLALRVLGWMGHAIALLALVLVATSRPVGWLAVPVLLGHGLALDRQLARRRARDWRRFRWAADQQVNWTRIDGHHGHGRCVAARAWGASWVRLAIRVDGERRLRWLVLPRDATTRQAHRRLRVRCRIAPPRADRPEDAVV